MTETKIEIGAEEAERLWEQFLADSTEKLRKVWPNALRKQDSIHFGQEMGESLKHALALAVARERERSLSPVIEHLKRCEALTHQMGDRYDQRYQIAIETLEAVAKKIRGEE